MGPAPDTPAALRAELESCATAVVEIETLVLELIGRAGAQRDSAVIERAQALDALAQRLHRLARMAADLDAGAAPAPLMETLATLARAAKPVSAGDLDLF